MARGRASREEVVLKRISTLDEKINNCKAQIEKYEAEKQELQKELSGLKMQKLQALMDKKGVSVDELAALLENR